MLILTRRISETIKIGDDIEVTVLGVKGIQVRVGVTAPKEVSVHRHEKCTSAFSRKRLTPESGPEVLISNENGGEEQRALHPDSDSYAARGRVMASCSTSNIAGASSSIRWIVRETGKISDIPGTLMPIP